MVFILEYPGKVLEFSIPFSVGTLHSTPNVTWKVKCQVKGHGRVSCQGE